MQTIWMLCKAQLPPRDKLRRLFPNAWNVQIRMEKGRGCMKIKIPVRDPKVIGGILGAPSSDIVSHIGYGLTFIGFSAENRLRDLGIPKKLRKDAVAGARMCHWASSRATLITLERGVRDWFLIDLCVENTVGIEYVHIFFTAEQEAIALEVYKKEMGKLE